MRSRLIKEDVNTIEKWLVGETTCVPVFVGERTSNRFKLFL
jgi:hypothetical protein